MEPLQISLPDAKLHLSKLAAPIQAHNQPFAIEIRCLKQGSPPRSWRVDPYNEQMIDNALDVVSYLNSDGYNIYATVNPISPGGDIGKASTDEEVLAATFLFLDADDEGVARNIIERSEVPFDFVVVTGTQPFLRAHFYIQLEAPTEQISDWRLLMDRMIATHACDKSAKNPSRIMRLAGFVTHPDPGKIKKQYVSEVVKIYNGDQAHGLI
jgi:hypothetical protein